MVRRFSKFGFTKMGVTYTMVVPGNRGSPQVERGSVEREMFNLVGVLTFARTRTVPTKNNLEEQTVSSSLDLEETNFADLATSKVNTFLAQLGRSVNIQKVLTLQPFTILGITLAQLFLSPSYTQTVTLNSFSKHIQWLSPLQFQLPS